MTDAIALKEALAELDAAETDAGQDEIMALRGALFIRAARLVLAAQAAESVVESAAIALYQHARVLPADAPEWNAAGLDAKEHVRKGARICIIAANLWHNSREGALRSALEHIAQSDGDREFLRHYAHDALKYIAGGKDDIPPEAIAKLRAEAAPFKAGEWFERPDGLWELRVDPALFGRSA